MMMILRKNFSLLPNYYIDIKQGKSLNAFLGCKGLIYERKDFQLYYDTLKNVYK